MSICVKVMLNTLNNLDMSFIFCIFVQDLKLEVMTYQEWFKEIKWLKDKVILPDNIRISKSDYITNDGFNINDFNRMLFKTYNEKYPVSDGRRYKK